MTAGRVALLLLVALLLVSMPWVIHPFCDPQWDATLYVLTTRSLVQGDGYSVYGVPFHLRPPGFTLLLAPVMWKYGTNFAVLNRYVAGWGVAALALMFVYFRKRLGIGLAFALCGCLWLNPQYRKMCNAVLSDTAGLTLLFASFLLDRWVRARPTAGRHVLLGLLIGASLYLRSVALLVAPAIIVSRLLQPGTLGSGSWRRRLGRLSWIAVIPVLMQVPWSLWKQAHPTPVLSDQVGLHSYWTALFQENPADPDSPTVSFDELLDRVPLRFEQCMAGMGARLPRVTLPMMRSYEIEQVREGSADPTAFWLGIAALLAMVVMAAWRRDPGSLFALGNLALLLIYFDYDERILLPTYVFALVAVLELLRRGLHRVAPRRVGTGLLVLGLALLTWNDAPRVQSADYLANRHLLYRGAANWVRRSYPRATVAASLGHEFAVYLARPVYFLELAAAREQENGLRRVVKDRGVDLVVHTGLHNRYLGWWLEPFLEEHGKVVYRWQDLRIFELDRDRLDE